MSQFDVYYFSSQIFYLLIGLKSFFAPYLLCYAMYLDDPFSLADVIRLLIGVSLFFCLGSLFRERVGKELVLGFLYLKPDYSSIENSFGIYCCALHTYGAEGLKINSDLSVAPQRYAEVFGIPVMQGSLTCAINTLLFVLDAEVKNCGYFTHFGLHCRSSDLILVERACRCLGIVYTDRQLFVEGTPISLYISKD